MTVIRATKINWEMLAWVRKSAGFTVEEVARKISSKMNPDRVREWEDGKTFPTVKQLYKIADIYKRPLGTFFLSEFPKDFTIPKDFRRLPGEVSGIYSAALRRQIRLAEERLENALDLYEVLGEAPLEFVPSATLEDDPDKVARQIRDILEVDSTVQFGWRDRSRYRPLHEWRNRIETAGALVFQITDVDTNEMLGFSFAETTLPVVAVNRKLRPNGRIFTMLHEFTHLMLRQSGICDLDEDAPRPPEENRIERFCNRVAGAALVPEDALVNEPIVAGHPGGTLTWHDEEIEGLADTFSVSREVIIRRLLILGRTTEAFYRQKRREYQAQLGQKKSGGGPENRAVRAISTLGQSYIELVFESYNREAITLSQAVGLIGERAKWMPEIERRMAS